MPAPTPTVVIESNQLLRDGLRHILSSTHFRVVASAATVQALSSNSPLEPRLVILGAGKSKADTALALQNCQQRFPNARRLVLDEHCDRCAVLAAFRAGADAYLLKSITTEALIKSLDVIVVGGTVVPGGVLCEEPALPQVAELTQHNAIDLPRAQAPYIGQAPLNGHGTNGHAVRAAMPFPLQRQATGYTQLSAREVSTLQCLVHGYSNKVIARQFAITEATVKVHVKAILRKIRVLNRTQAAIWAVNNLNDPGTSLSDPSALEAGHDPALHTSESPSLPAGK